MIKVPKPTEQSRQFMRAYAKALERQFDFLGYASRMMLGDDALTLDVCRAAELSRMILKEDLDFEVSLERLACKHKMTRKAPREPWPSDWQLSHLMSMSFFNAVKVVKGQEPEAVGWCSGAPVGLEPPVNGEKGQSGWMEVDPNDLSKLIDAFGKVIGEHIKQSLEKALQQYAEEQYEQTEDDEDEEDDSWEDF